MYSKAVLKEIEAIQEQTPTKKKANYFGKLKLVLSICITFLTFKSL